MRFAQYETGNFFDEMFDANLEPRTGARALCQFIETIAWQLFGNASTGANRIQAICDYVHRHITFSYQDARSTRTAWEAFHEQKGVCRDYAHLAIAFCRCLNIPARYCTGYLGDIGITPMPGPMDFAAWFEAYIGGHWHIFDARNNVPRIGRVLIARGRDATDVAISNTFGPNTLASFTVWADEVSSRMRPIESGNGLKTVPYRDIDGPEEQLALLL